MGKTCIGIKQGKIIGIKTRGIKIHGEIWNYRKKHGKTLGV